MTTPKQNCSCNLNNDSSGYKFASCVYQNVKTVVSRRYWLIQGRDFLSLIALCCPALKYQMEKWLFSPSGEVRLWSMTNEFTRDFIKFTQNLSGFMKYTYFATVYLPNKKALGICKISFQNLHRQAIKKFRNFHSFKTKQKKKKKKKKKQEQRSEK